MPRGNFAPDLAGKRFGRLLVLGRHGRSPRGQARWRCQCDCGNISLPITSSLTSVGVISCGCHRIDVIGKYETCGRCGEQKLHKEFSRQANGKIGTYCRPCLKLVNAERYKLDPEAIKERSRAWSRAERIGVLNAYGWQCVCCGETQERFLAVDHRNGGGGRHRKELGFSGARFYKWLRERGYPSDYQILCTNCNWGKHVNRGECPHIAERVVAALSMEA